MERILFRSPKRWMILLERLGIREISPADICVDPESKDAFYAKYPDLAGDKTAIGPGDDGNCQSWRGDIGWWREFVERK